MAPPRSCTSCAAMAEMVGTTLEDFAWEERAAARPAVDLADYAGEASEKFRRVWKGNSWLRRPLESDGFCGRNGDGSASTRAWHFAYRAGRCGIDQADAARALLKYYSRPGQKGPEKAIRTMAQTLRAWQQGREEAEAQAETTPGNGLGAAQTETPSLEEEAETTPRADDEDHGGVGAPGEEGQRTTIAPFHCLPAPDFLSTDFGTSENLVPGIGLRTGGAAELSGQGGDGKSMMFLAIASAWAEGLPPFGCHRLRPARPLRIVVGFIEDDPSVVQERLKIQLGGKAPSANLILFTRAEPLHLAGLKGKPDPAALARLQATLAAHRPVDLLALDPMAYLHDAEENSSSEMLRWLRPFRECARAAGAATWLVHHAGWEAGRGRGSTAIRAWADLELALERREARGREVIILSLAKANFAAHWPEPIVLRFDPTTFNFEMTDEATGLCPPESLVAWIQASFGGEWEGAFQEFDRKATEHFGCSERTIRESLHNAAARRLLEKSGRGKTAKIQVLGGDAA